MSWTEIKKAVNSDLSKPLNELIEEIPSEISPQVNAMKSLIGQANPTASNRTTVMNYLKIIEGLSSMSVIRSIQRGIAIGERNGNATVGISSVDPSKCIVIIDNSLVSHNPSGLVGRGAYLLSVSSGSITFGGNYEVANRDSAYAFSWQIIEFR